MKRGLRECWEAIKDARMAAGTCTECGKHPARRNRLHCLTCASHQAQVNRARYTARRPNARVNRCGNCRGAGHAMPRCPRLGGEL